MNRTGKILIVDDNEDLCEMLADILEMEGFSVDSAFDGFEAIKVIGDTQYDTVLMDIMMPDMNGVETYKKLKKLTPDTPVIMITAFAVEDLVNEALREGAFAALHKPLDFDQLFTVMDQARAGGEFILVVDDEQQLCNLLKRTLETQGFRVCVAHTGEHAIQLSRTNHFDIVLMDMKLPTLNGLDTYLAIKNIRPSTVTVLITGNKDEAADMVKQAIENSAYTCLQKPLDMDTFIPLLNSILEQKRTGTLRKPDQPL